MANHIKGDEVQIEDLGDGISRQIMGYTDNLMLVKVYFKKGSVGYTHSHIHDQITFVESGKFEITIDDEKKILTSGDSCVVNSGVEHGAVCLEDGILIDTFSPHREDFLMDE
jgi:quercetin dioxygenase-like cupin family protein